SEHFLVSCQCRGYLALALVLQGGAVEPVETYGHFTPGSARSLTGKMGTRPYESYIHPVTILSTLPSAGVGALLALLCFKTELSLIAIIGIILLIGIVKKNAIMMIDFALAAERHEDKSPVEAIFQACLLRFRPTTMTTMAALLGGLPLALGTGTGAE